MNLDLQVTFEKAKESTKAALEALVKKAKEDAIHDGRHCLGSDRQRPGTCRSTAR